MLGVRDREHRNGRIRLRRLLRETPVCAVGPAPVRRILQELDRYTEAPARKVERISGNGAAWAVLVRRQAGTLRDRANLHQRVEAAMQHEVREP